MHSFDLNCAEYDIIVKTLENCTSWEQVLDHEFFAGYHKPSEIAGYEHSCARNQNCYDGDVIIGDKYVIKSLNRVSWSDWMPKGLEEFCMPRKQINDFYIQPRCDISHEAVLKAVELLKDVPKNWDYHMDNIGLYNGKAAVFDW